MRSGIRIPLLVKYLGPIAGCSTWIFFGSPVGWSAEAKLPPPIDPQGDELSLFNDLPVVVSASRQQTAINKSPVPVSVVSSEDIQAGGHYRIEEMLRFVPGVDVLRIDRNYYAVGVRGFHGTISDRTLTLINGRNADSSTFGGSEFYRQPLLVGDIDHIEVVRGPGSAAWGANAYNGVINIITKDPEDTLGIQGASTVTGFGDSYTEARWSEVSGPFSWRIGGFYEYHRSSSNALDDQSFPDNDWGEKKGTDNEVVLRLNSATTLRGGLGYALIDCGSFEFLGRQSTNEDSFETTRAFLRFDQDLSEDFSYRLGWYGNFLNTVRQAVFNDRTQENVAELQLDYQGFHQHKITLGGEWRAIDIEALSNGNPTQINLINAPYHEQRYGAFLIDRWEMFERFALEGQLRGDNYSGTESDWAGRVAGLYGIDKQQHHVLRLAAARAYRTPLPALRNSSYTNLSLPLIVIPNDDLENEKTWSIEGGYVGQYDTEIMTRVDTYYQRYENLIGFKATPTGAQPQNINGADGYGGEIEVGWTPMTQWSSQRAKWTTWYGLNYLETDTVNQEIRGFLPSRHKVGSTIHLPLPNRFAFAVNYAYNNSTNDPDANSPTPQHIGIHHQCDITLSYAIPQWRGEIMMGVWDVFHQEDDPVYATGTYTPHETPGRTFFVRGQLGF